MPHNLIVIEGIDGIGKATQSKLLAKKLDAELYSFPNYNIFSGKQILKMNQSPKPENAHLLQSLHTINRLEANSQIKNDLDFGNVVLDRYITSGLVYGYLDGIDLDWIWNISAGLWQPDIEILLDAPVELSFQRRPERRDALEQDRGLLEKARNKYLELFTNSKYVPNGYIISAESDESTIHHQIMNILKNVNIS